MKFNRIIKFVVSLILTLAILLSVAMPVFAFTSPEPTGNKFEDFINNLMFSLSFAMVAIFILPIALIISIIQAVFSGSISIFEAIPTFFEEFISMWGF